MTASSDFLPFATGGSANVVSQASWAADSVVTNGFVAGIAQSSKVNKAVRQASFVSAGLAKFIANELAIHVADDGDLPTFVTNLGTAFATLAAGSVSLTGYLLSSTAATTYAPLSRTISTAGLATGGGDLSANRTITVPKATSSDVITGTDDTKALTALALATGSAPTVSGQQTSTRMPGGLIIKTGTTNAGAPYSEGTISDSFATAFPNNCFQVIPVAINLSGNLFRDIWPQRESISTSGFTFVLQWSGVAGTTNSIDGIDWVAFGN